MAKFFYAFSITLCNLLPVSQILSHNREQNSLRVTPAMNLENHIPVVKFLQPQSGQLFDRNTTVPYTVDVSDAEDGESAYEEINSKEIWVRLKFSSSKAAIDIYRKQKTFADTVGVYSMVISNCFNCHAVKTKLAGPSFQDISLRYADKPALRQKLEQHVKEGSSGIWGKEVMPTHPELEQKEIKKMVGWIIQYGKDPGLNILIGAKGVLPLSRPEAKNQTGNWIATAFYTDHGSGNTISDRQTGYGQILLKTK